MSYKKFDDHWRIHTPVYSPPTPARGLAEVVSLSEDAEQSRQRRIRCESGALGAHRRWGRYRNRRDDMEDLTVAPLAAPDGYPVDDEGEEQ